VRSCSRCRVANAIPGGRPFKCQLEVVWVSQAGETVELEAWDGGRGPSLWQFSWMRLLMGDGSVCLPHLSLGVSYFTVPGEEG
jgi:hypothetical protein